MKRFGGSLLRGSAFFLAVAAATCFPMVLGGTLWPNGLSAGTELIFWPATGVAVAGLLLLGGRFWIAILLGVFLPVFAIREVFASSLINAVGNTAEALAAWALLSRVGRFSGDFAHFRTVGALLLAAMLTPLLSVIPGVINMVAAGVIPRSEAAPAFGVWWLANGSAMLLLTPFIVALFRGGWTFPAQRTEATLWLAVGLALGAFAFDAIFRMQGENLAFLTFPFVIYAAIRFGPSETAASLVVVMASIYATMARHAGAGDPTATISTLAFLQAFCFVLSATGLAVAALVRERRTAEAHAHEESKRALEVSLLAERARLEALRYQINPHFLFNTLNSLRATLPHTADISREMVGSIADYFRSVVDHPAQDTAPLRDEIESVKRYLAIEKTRFEENLQISFRIDANAEAAPVPVFLLQPLVENAIRHGFAASPPPYHLEIRVTRADVHLSIEVANSGSWCESSTPARQGVGLENIRERLRLLHGDQATFHITTSDGWVRAKIELPVTNDHLPDR